MSSVLQAIPTEHGLDVLSGTLKSTVTKYALWGATTHDATKISAFHSATIESSYFDDNGVLTFQLNLPIETDFKEYLHKIVVLDESDKVVIECATPKVALAKGVGGMVTLKAAVSGEAGEVVFKSSEFVTKSELNELFLAPVHDRFVGENLLINGCFRVNQRSFNKVIDNGIGEYTLDRWICFATRGSARIKSGGYADTGTNTNYLQCLAIQNESTTETTRIGVSQRIELGTTDYDLSKGATLSFDARGVDAKIDGVLFAYHQAGKHTNERAWSEFKTCDYELNIASNRISVNIVPPHMDYKKHGKLDYFEVIIYVEVEPEQWANIVQVKLEVGAIATQFIADHPVMNLTKCQYFFRKAERFSRANYEAMESREEQIKLSPHMRATPAVVNVTGLKGHNRLTAHSGGVSIYAGGTILSSQFSENVVFDLDAEI